MRYAARSFTIARTSAAGDAAYCPGLVAIRFLARRHERACRDAQRSTAALLFMEDISLPTRCKGAWAMVKTRYAKADLNHMAEVGPVGSDGQEIPVSLVYDQVALAAKYSQQNCRLDSL